LGTETARKTLAVSLAVSLVCSILVSATAVTLNERQQSNRAGFVLRTIMTDLDLLEEGEPMTAALERTEQALVDLSTGEIMTEEDWDERLNPSDFDIQRLAGHPEYGRDIPGEKDMARIGRMPKYMKVFIVRERESDSVEKYALTIYGRGLYSTLYGVISLAPDMRTVEGLTFYDHGETPGLGGEVDNRQWKESWKGKQAFDEQGNVRIEVLGGPVDLSRPEARFQVDGLTGATHTTRGVDRLVRFWLGDQGYGPFIRKVRGG
jgi:Na+-transporting NADH:ubiquinone oxidoreductase subunit C